MRVAKKLTVLITGINGYLGRYIAEDCDQYNSLIIGSGRQQSKNKIREFRKANLLEFDADELLDGVDIVIHAAAIIPSKRQKNNFEDNTTMTRKLAEACITKQVKHFIYISSASIYEKSEKAHEETSSLRPEGPYGKSKLRSEEVLKEYEENLRISILRMGTIFGPDMPLNNNIQRLIQALASGRFIKLGSAQNKKSLLHVNDAARACSHLAFIHEPKQNKGIAVFNISPPPLKMAQIIDTICKGLGRKKPLAIPMPLIQVTMKLLKPLASIFRPFGAIHNSVTKFLSNDILDGNKFITQTDFEFNADNLQALLKVSQKMT